MRSTAYNSPAHRLILSTPRHSQSSPHRLNLSQSSPHPQYPSPLAVIASSPEPLAVIASSSVPPHRHSQSSPQGHDTPFLSVKELTEDPNRAVERERLVAGGCEVLGEIFFPFSELQVISGTRRIWRNCSLTLSLLM